MRSLSLGSYLAILAAGLVACSVTTTSPPPPDPIDNPTLPPADAGAADGGQVTAPDAHADAGSPDVSVADTGPLDTPLFALTLNGQPVAPATLTAEKVHIGGDTHGFSAEARITANFPVGPNDWDNIGPKLSILVSTPAQGAVPFDDSYEYVQYVYHRSTFVGLPYASGAGFQIARDGRDGWFEGSASGTLEIDGQPQAFTVTWRQKVDAIP